MLTVESTCRPQYVVYPNDAAGFGIDDQFFLGSSGLLVKPVVQEGSLEAEVYLADDQVSFVPSKIMNPDSEYQFFLFKTALLSLRIP